MGEQDKKKGEVKFSLTEILKDLSVIFLSSRDPHQQAISIKPGKGFLHQEEKEILMDAIRQMVPSTDEINWVDTKTPKALMINMKNFSKADLEGLKRKLRR